MPPGNTRTGFEVPVPPPPLWLTQTDGWKNNPHSPQEKRPNPDLGSTEVNQIGQVPGGGRDPPCAQEVALWDQRFTSYGPYSGPMVTISNGPIGNEEGYTPIVWPRNPDSILFAQPHGFNSRQPFYSNSQRSKMLRNQGDQLTLTMERRRKRNEAKAAELARAGTWIEGPSGAVHWNSSRPPWPPPVKWLQGKCWRRAAIDICFAVKRWFYVGGEPFDAWQPDLAQLSTPRKLTRGASFANGGNRDGRQGVPAGQGWMAALAFIWICIVLSLCYPTYASVTYTFWRKDCWTRLPLDFRTGPGPTRPAPAPRPDHSRPY